MAAMAHEHHAVHPSDLDVLDAVTMGRAPPLQHEHRYSHASRRSSSSSVASSSSQLLNSRNGAGHVQQGRRRPLDTLQALRRPPIDPIVLAASLSSGPQVTRHHFLHSFGPKQQSRQMTRSEHIRRQQEDEAREAHRLRIEEEAKQSGQRPSTSSLKGNHASKFRPRAGSYANCDADDVAAGLLGELAIVDEASAYRSRQAPRSARLEVQKEHEERKAALRRRKEEEKAARQARYEQNSVIVDQGDDRLAEEDSRKVAATPAQDHARLSPRRTRVKPPMPTCASLLSAPGSSSLQQPPPLEMRCMARTRVPTPHGEVFCHIYTNNHDNKEHLALVIDPEQNSPRTTAALEQGRSPSSSGFIRSRTLDAKWPGETDMDRIVRGAYVGRLSSSCQLISAPVSRETEDAAIPTSEQPEAPLVRIHSECYTGETIGSQRCDCGEQLDEAIRLIHAGERPVKGVVVYLRQEGRGIGLLNKIMAYNLQDMGHDTVNANIMLGHLADARKYDIAAEILRDLDIPECQLLTNNPEKIDALEAEGIRVVKRVPMVPRIWRLQDINRPRRRKHSHRHRHTHKQGGRAQHKKDSTLDTASSLVKTGGSRLESSIISQFEDGAKSTDDTGSPVIDEIDASDMSSAYESDSSQGSYDEHVQRRAGATMVGASSTRGPELEKYLRTKIERMGHMLDVPPEELAKVASKLSGKSERSASQSHASAPPLAHLTDDKGAVPQSIEGVTEDQADDAASHDDYSYDVHDMPRSVELCATDSAPGTASDSEHANVHSHDFAESPSEGDNDEDDDDQILVNAPGDAKK